MKYIEIIINIFIGIYFCIRFWRRTDENINVKHRMVS